MIQLVDDEYSLEEESTLDSCGPELIAEAGIELEILVYLLCIIRSAYTVDEAQSSRHTGTGSPSYSYGLIRSRKPNTVTYMHIGYYRFHMPNRWDGLELLRFKKSFFRKTITIS
jgi:hypothetical protein